MNIFSYESRFSQVLLKISYSCWLNCLWVLCSIPVFTCGAATTALYAVTLKIAEDKEHNITAEFFKAFRDNFKQATKLWLIMLAVGIVLGIDGYAVYHLRAASTGTPAVLWTLNLALLIAAAVIYVIVMTYLFPLTARFSNTDLAMFRNSFLIGVRYLFCTILVFAIHFAMFFAVVAIFTPLAIFGEGLCALLSSMLMISIFQTIAYNQEEGESDEG
ncbi:MAG: YesL family protein [Solobacterium sp.]|nr:YesL family protein [Solobacterium sp.]